MTAGRPHLLPSVPNVPADLFSRVKNDHDRFAREGLPANLEAYLLDAYALDMTGSYAGLPVRNPWGKAWVSSRSTWLSSRRRRPRVWASRCSRP